MAYFKALILFAVVAAAFAAEETARPKKDVLLATPYAGVPVSYAVDDGSYYRGKYEKTYVSAALPAAYSAIPAAYSAVPAAYSAVPAAYSAVPAAYSAVPASYSAFPYAYSAYHYRPVVV